MDTINNTSESISGNNLWESLLAMNTVQDYIISIIVIVGGIAIIGILHKVVQRRLSKSENIYMRYVSGLHSYIFPLLYLLVLYIAYRLLTVGEKTEVVLNYAFTIACMLLLIRLMAAAVTSAIRSYLLEHDESGDKLKQIRGILIILNVVMWIVGLIFLFDNLGFNVTAVLTGLGVGGIAIALAAQTILGDLFNYFVIFFDRPFELGDFIIVDDKLGTVEYIGLKTTRIRSLQGEQVVFSNTNLTNSRIHNYKRMAERRILFKLQLVYETSYEKLQAIPGIVRSIVEGQGDTRFDRAHFSAFSEYSLTVEVVYYILSADYNRYMDIQQQINLGIVRAFHQNRIRFALPTYHVKMKKKKKPDTNHADVSIRADEGRGR